MIKEIKFTDNALKQIESLLAKKDKGSFFRIAIKVGVVQASNTNSLLKNQNKMTI